MPVHVRRRSFRAPLGLAAMGFSAALLAGQARAEDGFHPLDSTLRFLDLKTDTGTVPDFVAKSRPDDKTKSYMAVGAKPPDRALKIKTPAEVKAMTAELDAARAAQLAGKRPKPPSTAPGAKPAAAKPAAAKAAAAKPAPRRIATDR